MTKVKMYTTPYCPFCIRAKQFFSDRGIAFEDTDVSNQPDVRQKVSAENGNWPTVPMIIVGDTFVGGFTDLINFDKSGKLSELLG